MFLLVLVSIAGAGCARAAPIRVMSFNIRYGDAPDGGNDWPHRRELLTETIKSYDPDLLGAQEVLAYQADELRARLAGHEFVGVGREDGARQGEMMAIFYRRLRFEETGRGHFWLSESPQVAGSKSWGTAFARMATWVRLRDRRAPKRQLLVINTHFDHASSLARVESARLIAAAVQRLGDGGRCAVIVTGDLNSSEDEEPMAQLRQSSLSDSYRQVHPARGTDEATFHEFKGAVRGSRIDFILHSRDLLASDATIDRTTAGGHYPSDHFPVTAVLGWAR